MTYLVSIKDHRGDIVDDTWFHSRVEAREWVAKHHGEHFRVFSALWSGENAALSWGEYPGGTETDYDMMCGGCGEMLWRGLSVKDG